MKLSKNKLSRRKLQEYINQLYKFYQPVDLNSAYHSSKVKAIQKLNFILKRASRKDVQESEFEELLIASLTVVYYFGMRIKLSGIATKYWGWFSKRNFTKAEATFHKTMDTLLPELTEVTIKISLKFFTDISLWPFENFVVQILEVILYFTRGMTTIFSLMLTDIHCVLFIDVKSARHRMRVLYELLNSPNWVINSQKLLPFVKRLLDFFAFSISKHDTNLTAYTYLRQGFEVCLRRIFRRVDNSNLLTIITTMLNWFSTVNMSDDDVLEFSSLLDYAAKLYKVGTYSESLREGLIKYILTTLVGSINPTYSIVGCRLLQQFLDRQGNSPYLIVPTIYYEFSQVRLKVRECDSGDKGFIRKNRELIHENLLKAVKLHNNNVSNLKLVYSVVTCMVLEVPCGLSAAAAACMMMALQDLAINGENISAISRYWMHAIVISVMSLICWIHKASVLYRYVYDIISRRAKEAPQLNPPLMQTYTIGHHHVTWNKPTLFFEDWELRYGLWKHFQDTQPSTRMVVRNIRKKIPSMDVRN